MTTAPEITVLLVSDNPEISQTVRRFIYATGGSYRLLHTSSRTGFLVSLHDRFPGVLLVGEEGLPGLTLSEIIDAAQRFKTTIPLVVMGRRRVQHSAPHVLRADAYEYLHFDELERLPRVLEHALRDGHAHKSRLALQHDAAELLRENQKLVTIGRLSGSIAHEINNPLESVTNLLFLMENDRTLPPPLHNYLTLAQEELGRAVQITKQTLNFCRETVAPVRIKLSSLLDEVMVLYARRIAEKRIQVIRQVKSQESISVFPGEIRQIFSNLISNAIEASSKQGKLYVRIRRSHLWGDAGVTGVRVTIADNGIGIPEEVRRRIGEPFFTTKGQGGTGLGLWVTQSIVERYGGNLLLHSSTGERHGTVFSLFLPTNLRPQAVADSIATPANPKNSRRAIHPRRATGGTGAAKRQGVAQSATRSIAK